MCGPHREAAQAQSVQVPGQRRRTHLPHRSLINKLLANDFFSADSGHARFSRLTHKPPNSVTTNLRMCARPRPRSSLPRPTSTASTWPMFSVNCGWTTMIRRQLQNDTELINKIAFGKTSKSPRAASTAPSTKPPPLRAEHQPGKLKHPSACRLLYRKRRL